MQYSPKFNLPGANLYYVRHVLHNWADDEAKRILSHIVTAMSSSHCSRLLVIDPVIPEADLSFFGASLDIQMINIGGIERTEAQWRALLEGSGLEVINVTKTGDLADTGIIEAVKK